MVRAMPLCPPPPRLSLTGSPPGHQVKEGHDSTVRPKTRTWEFDNGRKFLDEWAADGKPGSIGNLRYNTIMSGLTFYLYNEVSTMALKSLSGVSHSVANTAKRAVVIIGSAIAFGEDMGFMKTLGCSIAIGGTFLYAIADDIAKSLSGGDKKKKK